MKCDWQLHEKLVLPLRQLAGTISLTILTLKAVLVAGGGAALLWAPRLVSKGRESSSLRSRWGWKRFHAQVSTDAPFFSHSWTRPWLEGKLLSDNHGTIRSSWNDCFWNTTWSVRTRTDCVTTWDWQVNRINDHNLQKEFHVLLNIAWTLQLSSQGHRESVYRGHWRLFSHRQLEVFLWPKAQVYQTLTLCPWRCSMH